jgi:hypothetical protein
VAQRQVRQQQQQQQQPQSGPTQAQGRASRYSMRGGCDHHVFPAVLCFRNAQELLGREVEGRARVCGREEAGAAPAAAPVAAVYAHRNNSNSTHNSSSTLLLPKSDCKLGTCSHIHTEWAYSPQTQQCTASTHTTVVTATPPCTSVGGLGCFAENLFRCRRMTKLHNMYTPGWCLTWRMRTMTSLTLSLGVPSTPGGGRQSASYRSKLWHCGLG